MSAARRSQNKGGEERLLRGTKPRSRRSLSHTLVYKLAAFITADEALHRFIREPPWLHLISISCRIIVGKMWLWRINRVCVKRHSLVFFFSSSAAKQTLDLIRKFSWQDQYIAAGKYSNYESGAQSVKQTK